MVAWYCHEGTEKVGLQVADKVLQAVDQYAKAGEGALPKREQILIQGYRTRCDTEKRACS